MENQHRKITGYRELNQAEIDLMNEIKAEGVKLDVLLAKVTVTNEELKDVALGQLSNAHRWTAIAKTDFQTGLMALTRAVAKPDFF